MPKHINKTIYFGRLNVICPFTKEEKIEYIFNSLNKQMSEEEKDFMYGFFEIKRFNHMDKAFVTGLLVKYKIETDEEIVDESNRVLDKTMIPNKIIAKSEFILHLHSGIIAYHPITNHIPNNKFRTEFCKLLEKANNRIFVNAEIQPIDEEAKIFEAIKKFEIIYSLKIALHPSNPSNRNRWKKTDDKLRKMEVENYCEIYRSRHGIKIDENDEAYGNIIMAADGYGEARIKGTREGKETSASTTQLQMTLKVENEPLLSSMELLYKSFHKIFERFEKNDKN